MKIYFAGSIRGGRDDAEVYRQLIEYLQRYAEVLTEHIGEDTLSDQGESDKDVCTIHDRDMDWLLSADMIVAEVSNPSLGVGYEIGRAVEHDIPVVCLYQSYADKKLSPMIAGADKVRIIYYDEIINAFGELQTALTN